MGGARSRGVPEEAGRAPGAVLHDRRLPGQARLHGGRHRRDAARGHRAARPLPVHARPLPDHVPQPHLDDAADRGLRHRRGHQPALQVPDRAGPDRHLDRLRHADADGLRLRPPDERGRGRPRRRGDRHARRHGGPARRHRPREDLGVADDQSDRVDPARDVRRARRAARLRPEEDLGHRAGRHPQGVHGAEGVHLPDRAVGPHLPRHHHVLGAEPAALQPDQHLRLPHLRGRFVAGAGSGVHAREPDRLRRGSAEDRHDGRRVRAAAGVLLRVARRTSSRKSRSSGRCGAATRRS